MARAIGLASILLLAGCNGLGGNRFGGPMAIDGCAIRSAEHGRSVFAADVQNQKNAPAVAFSIMAARTGRIVVANGDNIATYEFKRRLKPGESAHVEVDNPHGAMRSVSDCTIAHIDFADGTQWSMPTPEF